MSFMTKCPQFGGGPKKLRDPGHNPISSGSDSYFQELGELLRDPRCRTKGNIALPKSVFGQEVLGDAPRSLHDEKSRQHVPRAEMYLEKRIGLSGGDRCETYGGRSEASKLSVGPKNPGKPPKEALGAAAF